MAAMMSTVSDNTVFVPLDAFKGPWGQAEFS
jgi:hypothetical protein